MKRFHGSRLPSSRSEAEIPHRRSRPVGIYRDAFLLSFFRLIPYSLILIPLFVLPAFTQQRWERNYGGADTDVGYSVQQTSDGGYIVVGWTYSFGNNAQVYLIKTNASGDTLWTRNYGGTDYDHGSSVQQTQDGGYIVAGGTNSFGNMEQVYLVKTNASGDTLWTRTYGGTSVDWGSSVQQTSDYGYIIAGMAASFGGVYVYLIKTNALGDTLWTRTCGGADWDAGESVRRIMDRNYEEDPMVGVAMGRALIRNDRWTLARENYDKLAAMGYESPEIELGLGICEHHLGLAGFKKHLEKALRMAPRFHEARSYMGNVLFDEGKYEEALECFDKIPLPRHQDPASLKRAMLLSLDLREDFERAFQYAHRLSELYPHLGTVDEVIQDILKEDGEEKK